MDIGQMPLFSALKARMNFLIARQDVLSQNVANANTPGYRAQDLKAPDFAAQLRQAPGAAGVTGIGDLKLAATRTGHLTASSGGAGSGYTIEAAPGAEATPDGNTVSLEEQMMKVSQSQMDYAAASQIYRQALNLLRIASGIRG